MVPRSVRPLRLVALALLGLPVATGTAAAQFPESVVEAQVGFVLSFAGTFLLNLAFGGVAVVAAPDLVRDVVRRVRADPVVTPLAGLGAVVLGAALLFALVLTVIGIVVAVPGVIVLALYFFVTGVLSTVAVGYLLLDAVADATLWSGLFVGAFLSAALSVVPLVGGTLTFLMGLFGTGAVSLRLYEGYRG
jgi:hypothetical protein